MTEDPLTWNDRAWISFRPDAGVVLTTIGASWQTPPFIAATTVAAATPVAPSFLKAIADRLVIIVPYVWLLVFFLIPFAIVFKISLSQTAIAMPPYTPVFAVDSFLATAVKELSFDNYVWLTEDALYFNAYVSSVVIAAISTFLTLLIGYPIAYGMARAPTTIRPILLMLVILPFWTSFLIRVYAWIGILKPEGLLNQVLLATRHHRRAADHPEHPLRRSSSASSIPTCRS